MLGNEEKEPCPESKRLCLLEALGRHSVLTGMTREPSGSTGSGGQGQGGVEEDRAGTQPGRAYAGR